MSKLEIVQEQIRALPKEQAEALHEWLEDLLEDQLEFTPGFLDSIERAEAQIAGGEGRIAKP